MVMEIDHIDNWEIHMKKNYKEVSRNGYSLCCCEGKWYLVYEGCNGIWGAYVWELPKLVPKEANKQNCWIELSTDAQSSICRYLKGKEKKRDKEVFDKCSKLLVLPPDQFTNPRLAPSPPYNLHLRSPHK